MLQYATQRPVSSMGNGISLHNLNLIKKMWSSMVLIFLCCSTAPSYFSISNSNRLETQRQGLQVFWQNILSYIIFWWSGIYNQWRTIHRQNMRNSKILLLQWMYWRNKNISATKETYICYYTLVIPLLSILTSELVDFFRWNIYTSLWPNLLQ